MRYRKEPKRRQVTYNYEVIGHIFLDTGQEIGVVENDYGRLFYCEGDSHQYPVGCVVELRESLPLYHLPPGMQEEIRKRFGKEEVHV